MYSLLFQSLGSIQVSLWLLKPVTESLFHESNSLLFLYLQSNLAGPISPYWFSCDVDISGNLNVEFAEETDVLKAISSRKEYGKQNNDWAQNFWKKQKNQDFLELGCL